MNVICLQEPAFYALVDNVVDYIKKTHQAEPEWISAQKAMDILHITSKETLRKLRDGDDIEFSKIIPTEKLKEDLPAQDAELEDSELEEKRRRGKILLYKTKSLYDFLKRNSNRKY